MLTCKETWDEASDHYDRAMEPERAREFGEHLEDCPACRSFYRTFVLTVDAARELLVTDPPPEVVEAVVREIERRLAS